jgi:Ca2+-binding RTX toxin-like protein
MATINGDSFYNSLNGVVDFPLLFDLDDIINGFEGNDILAGLNTNDTLNGGLGNDTLNGGDGDDEVNGDEGNDTAVGSIGYDIINGGAGFDRIDYSTLESIVTLSAFGAINKGSLGADLLVSVEEIVGSNILGDVIDLGGATAPAATSTNVNLALGKITINENSSPLPLNFTISQFENVRGSNLVDTITGNTANNSLSGASGNDTIDGGAGNDTINGGAGIDTASYASSSAGVSVSLAFQGIAQNTLTAGADVLISIENLSGSSFADILSGNLFANLITAGAGNDSIFGSSGNDSIDGGAGTDTANYSALGGLVSLGAFGVLNKGALGIDSLVGIETIVGSILLGDTVDHSAAISSGSVVFSGTNTNLTTGLVTVNGTGAPLPLSFTVQQFENVIGSNFNDTIIGNTANNSLAGGDGNDTINGLGGNDTIDGGSGIDTASYDTLAAGVNVSLALQGSAQNTLAAGSDLLISIENLIGTAFNDSLTGDTANNSLASGAGNDIIFASSGNDSIDGGSGTDTANYNALGGLVTLGAFGVLNKGGLGIDSLVGIETIVGSILLGDTVDHSAAISSGSVVFSGTNTNLTTGLVTVSGTGAPLPLSFTVQQFENVIGSNSSDTITGNTSNNSLNAGAGNDIIFGSSGNDIIDGGAGTDTANYSALGGLVSLGAFGVLNKGTLGIDSLVGIETIVGSSLLGDTVDHSAAISSGSVVFSGTNTNLTTGLVTVSGTGTPLPLSFTVQQFENVIGSNSNDTITGDAAANSLTGGAGNDTINGLGGNDTIDGGTGIDTASYDTLAAGVNVSLALQGALQNTLAAGSDLLISIENLIGTAFNDTLTGDAANNSLASGAGNDIIFASTGNDSIDGGAGTDTANYSALGGPVTLGAFGVLNKGGLGIDSLVGIETIVGSFLLGDTVDHSAAISSGGVIVSGTNTNLTTGLVTVNGTGAPLPLSFTVQQFEHVIGSNSSDTITGNTSNNSLNGGAGNDTINGLGGSDTLIGGLGNDVFKYTNATESAAGVTSRDTITDFQLGLDKLDLSAIDANSLLALDQAFSFLGNSATFTSAGQLRYQVTGGNLFLFGNIDAILSTAEFELQLSGLANIAASDIIL